ncbi:MAG: dihydrolipoyl dehydrogenase [Acidobacteriota bacterium]
MSRTVEVEIPDLGDFDQVDVIEVLVAEGDTVEADQDLITLESDKASMGIGASEPGTVRELRVAEGDQVKAGDVIAILEVGAGAAEAQEKDAEQSNDAEGGQEGEPAATPPPTEQAATAQAKDASTTPGGSDAARPATVDLGDTSDADVVVDLMVLGSGPGGYAAAFRAADLGLSVAMVERSETLGGVCLNVGCIPSKALLHVAALIEDAHHFGAHGVRFSEPEIDLDALRSWKDDVVDQLVGGVGQLAKMREVQIVHGEGRFTAPHRLEVEAAEARTTIAFRQAVVAAGSRPIELPGLPADDERLIDSTGALELRDVPERLLVIGGGIIGLEMATVYHALGSKITIVELTGELMPGTDRDLVKPLETRLRGAYEDILLNTKVTAVEPITEGLKVTFEGESAPAPRVFDRVLSAVGRRPNGDRIGAEAAGLEVDARGFLRVDRQQRTSVAHIFAIGDIVGQPMLAHKATHEGHVAAEVAAGHRASFDARVIPSVAYTDPEVAWAGVTEREAKEAGRSLNKAVFPWRANGRSLAMGRSEGSTKLLFDADTGQLVGAGIVGVHAGDLIAETALAIEMGCDADDIGHTIHPHPTLSETVGMSAEMITGALTDLYLPQQRKAAKERKARQGG